MAYQHERLTGTNLPPEDRYVERTDGSAGTWIAAVVAVLLVGGLAFYFSGDTGTTPATTTAPAPAATESAPLTPAPADTMPAPAPAAPADTNTTPMAPATPDAGAVPPATGVAPTTPVPGPAPAN